MKLKNLKISIVIPVYNEGDSLAACLNAIEKLNTLPDEIIVVDNNSTDHSQIVARSHDGVTLISEKKQGVVHARTRGFNVAKGDIIARIDADTVLPPDWIDKIYDIFARDKSTVAVSGRADYYDFILKDIANEIDRWSRNYLASRFDNRIFLHGANMAIRKSAWNKVRKTLCPCDGLHEDLDLAIHLQEQGLKVIYDENLIAGNSPRRIANGLRQFADYCLASPRTYKAHSISSRRYMYVIIFVVMLLYPIGHLAYASFDPKLGNFSLRYLFRSKLKRSRTSPTINVA